MRKVIIITVSILFVALSVKSQSDSMYVFQNENIIWRYGVSDIDSITFYAGDTIPETPLPKITGYEDNTFIDENGDTFFPWGFNYCNPALIDLVEDYWMMEDAWDIIENDFQQMHDYGANTVRIHLQYVKFMKDADTPDTVAFQRLKRYVEISEDNDIYIIVTGLGAYRLSDTLSWYDAMNDSLRWETQKLFWKTVAATVKDNPCIFAYDLINEPVVAVNCDSTHTTWYPGGLFGGYNFIQNISINHENEYWETIGVWADEMSAAIRTVDETTMITAGLLPLGLINVLSSHFDILSTHIYPKAGEIFNSVNYVINNYSDKPFLIEEFYNLSCSTDDLVFFLEQIDGYYNGLIGHYMGKTIEEYDTTKLVDYIHKEFLEFFIENNPNTEPFEW